MYACTYVEAGHIRTVWHHDTVRYIEDHLRHLLVYVCILQMAEAYCSFVWSDPTSIAFPGNLDSTRHTLTQAHHDDGQVLYNRQRDRWGSHMTTRYNLFACFV